MTEGRFQAMTGFNGAVTFWLRKFARNNRLLSATVSKLQWGRNFLVTEIRYVAGVKRESDSFNGAVTFWLRKWIYLKNTSTQSALLQWGRNFLVTEIRQALSFRWHDAMLQWGRNFLVTEIQRVLCHQFDEYPLQWGRNFLVTEICQILVCNRRRWKASMGP